MSHVPLDLAQSLGHERWLYLRHLHPPELLYGSIQDPRPRWAWVLRLSF